LAHKIATLAFTVGLETGKHQIMLTEGLPAEFLPARSKVLCYAVADEGTMDGFGLRLRDERNPQSFSFGIVVKPVLRRGTSPVSVRPYIQIGHSQFMTSVWHALAALFCGHGKS
jgi:hypothetical protein